jgi:nucleotidyltransferase/DNA polymerase involved in DNA repair
MKVVCFYFEEKTDLKNIAEIFYRYTPQIALSESAIFLEIEQCSRLFSENEFLELAKAIFLRLEITVKVGIAPSIPLALASASLGTKRLEQIPLSFLKYFLAPFCSDEKQEALLTKVLWYLKKLGLQSVKDFLGIPPRELSLTL